MADMLTHAQPTSCSDSDQVVIPTNSCNISVKTRGVNLLVTVEEKPGGTGVEVQVATARALTRKREHIIKGLTLKFLC